MVVTMKYTHTCVVFFILFSIGSNLNAGEIVTWIDPDGNTNITNLPPPQGAKIHNVIQYKEKTDEEISENERLKMQKRSILLKQQNIQEASKAKKKAKKYRKESEKAEVRAQEAAQKVIEYINKHSPRKKNKRRAYKYRSKKLVEAAEKAKAQAIQALIKANQAEKEALGAAKKAQEVESQNP